MTISSRITEELISAAVADDDLNDALFAFQQAVGVDDGGVAAVVDALFAFQQAVGVDDGGVAAVVFSGGWDEEWPSASSARRREMVDRYVALECFYAPSADDPELDEAGTSPTM